MIGDGSCTALNGAQRVSQIIKSLRGRLEIGDWTMKKRRFPRGLNEGKEQSLQRQVAKSGVVRGGEVDA